MKQSVHSLLTSKFQELQVNLFKPVAVQIVPDLWQVAKQPFEVITDLFGLLI